MTDPASTICAVATAPGRAGLSVIRVSGSKSHQILALLTGVEPTPRQACLRRLVDPQTGDLIDEAIVISFAGPASFTGEDVVEFHTHGSPAVTADLIRTLTAMAGVRLAAPGEFSRRAFFNGKLDLTEVEALADLIDAETSAQRRQALRQMSGSLGALYERWRHQLVRAGALFEAAIDFPDEDIPGGVSDDAIGHVTSLLDEISEHLDDGGIGERLRSGLVVALVGPPNAGKSTLLNWLAKRDVAIVTDEPGTTRDVLEVHLDLGGYPVLVLDLAGLREASGKIEQEGIRRARARADSADVRLFLWDGSDDYGPAWNELGVRQRPRDLYALTKSDCPTWNKDHLKRSPPETLTLSAVSGAGTDPLLKALSARAADMMASGSETVISRTRHRDHLKRCAQFLQTCLADQGKGAELAAENLRLAAQELGRLTGRIEVDDLLDVIFAEFCLGK